MLLSEYLANPYGRGTGVMPVSMIRDAVQRELRTDYPVPIQYHLYKIKSSGNLVIVCKLPSRSKKGVHYDIVIELDCMDIEENSKLGMAKFPFRVFSNSPSFYYTYAKVFEEKGLFCIWLKNKYDRKILRKNPEVRNPANIVGYERTIYTCMWFVYNQLRGVTMTNLLSRAIEKKYKDIATEIQTQDEVEEKYAHAPDTDAVRLKKEEAAKQRAAREASKPPTTKPKNATLSSPSSQKTQKSNKMQKTKKSSFFSKIKKIGR